MKTEAVYTGNDMQHVKWLCICVAAMAIILIAWVGSSRYSLEAEGFRFGGGSNDWSPIAFDSYLWKVPREPGLHPAPFPFIFWFREEWHYFPRVSNNHDPTRYRMIGSLLKKGNLVGKNKKDIRKLLGEPDSLAHDRKGNEIGDYGYTIRRPGGWGVLGISFDADKVKEATYSKTDDDPVSD
jgi:hypothetical protein